MGRFQSYGRWLLLTWLVAVVGANACGGRNLQDNCAPTQVRCGDACVDLQQAPLHCGACGMSCGIGVLCNQGQCQSECEAGLVKCQGQCIDPNVHNQFCGAMKGCSGVNAGNACEAGQLCDGSGVCSTNCQVGLIDCGGTCIDPLTDEQHCGAGANCAEAPGEVCPTGNLCDGSGTCALSCQPGMVEFGGSKVLARTEYPSLEATQCP